MFKKFTGKYSRPVIINIDYVSEIEYAINSSPYKTVINMTNGNKIFVREEYADVVRIITDNQVQVED